MKTRRWFMLVKQVLQDAVHPMAMPFCPLKLRRNRVICAALLAMGSAACTSTALAANILWVSDAPAGSTTSGVFSGPGTNLTDSGFVKLLQDAGYNVNRFNNPDSGATNLTAAEIAAINTNDLIIVGRASGSGGWQNNQATNWNRDVIRPMIIMSPYLVRTDGNRPGWFGGGNGVLPDDVPAPLTPGSSAEPTTDYIFRDVAMNGTNTASLYTEAMDRNTSHIQNAPVPGGIILATVTSPQEGSATIVTVNAIVGFPAGTAVRGGADILPAYRMYFSGGTRESATAPNGIPTYTGRENLTPVGESVFLRAVEVALNNGVAPSINAGPVDVVSGPANTTIVQGLDATFSITVTGAAPRLLEWQRSDGSGGFTNIPGTVTTFTRSAYSLSAVTLADDGAQFRVVASNTFNVVTSEVAQLSVTLDSAPPVVLSAGSLDGSTIVVCFNEPVSPDSALEESNYQLNSGTGPTVLDATIRADGRSVVLTLSAPIATNALLDVSYIGDLFSNVPDLPTSLVVSNLGLTGVDIGPVTPAGTNAVCSPNQIEVVGGGLDIGTGGGRIDHMRLAYRAVSGDFDARVRVVSFVGTNDHFETTAKALLVARESTATNSPAVNVWITPTAPGDNSILSNVRAAANGTTAAIGGLVTPNGLPNAWLRIKREGDVFTTFWSTDGTAWTAFGSVTNALAPTLNVGLGAVSHRNGKLVTATFADFRISQGSDEIIITNADYVAGTFSASFDSESGVVYTVEYKESLTTGGWNTLTNITGDGTLKSFNDSAVSPTGARFYRVGVIAVP